MCKKQRKLMNYNSLFTGLLIFILASSAIMLSGCEKQVIYTYNFDTESFHKYEEAVQERSFEKTFALLDDDNPDIRRLAWLALSRTLPTDTDKLFDRVKEETAPEAWISMTVQRMSDDRWKEIFDIWENEKAFRPAICTLMGRIGDRSAVSLLLSDKQYLKNSHECAFAVGGIASRLQLNLDMASDILSLAFETEDIKVRRNLLYGFYRTQFLNLERQYRTSGKIIEKWQRTIGQHPDIDRMMMRIYGQPVMNAVSAMWSQSKYHTNDEQVLIEMVRSMYEKEMYEFVTDDFYKLMLSTGNHHIIHITLDVLQRIPDVGTELTKWIAEEITGPTRNAEIFIKSLQLLKKENEDISPFKAKLEYHAKNSPIFLDRVIPIFNELYPSEKYKKLLFETAEEKHVGNAIAISAIIELWRTDKLDESETEKLKQLITEAVESNNPRVLRAAEQSLTEFDLFNEEELWGLYDRITGQEYEKWYELYHSFVRILARRFDQHFQDEIDELRSIDSFRLHQLLDQFEGEQTPFEGNRFKSVNWEKLSKLGSKPHWILKTVHGTIEIELDPLTAPFTVSAIAEYTRAGKYNNTPFHRVISNFVKQGGDFSMKNGSGTVPEIIPTEPTAGTFERGIAGVASSGIDTEGSQFFFTINWSPHLDGNYTIFGRAVRGMEIVDKIRVGDLVKSAEIQPR